MRWYYIFTKGVREQLRDYWILVMIVVMTPLFIGIYFLMSDPGTVRYDVLLVNQDQGVEYAGAEINLGDTLVSSLQSMALEDFASLVYSKEQNRENDRVEKGPELARELPPTANPNST